MTLASMICYITIKKFGVSKIFYFKDFLYRTFIQQWCFKLIKSDSRNIYKITVLNKSCCFELFETFSFQRCHHRKYWDTPFFRTEKGTSKTVATKMETIHVFKNCIFISVATVLEVSKMTVPICTSHWCLVMIFWLKVCIYSHTRGVKLGLGLGFMQTSQVLPHWLNQSFSFWTLPYTQRHCHDRIEKSPVQTVAIKLEAHNFLEYHFML